MGTVYGETPLKDVVKYASKTVAKSMTCTLAAVASAFLLGAASSTQPSTSPATLPVSRVPTSLPAEPVTRAPEPVTRAPEADGRALLARLTNALSELRGFRARGTFAADVDAAGETDSDSASFVSSYAAPSRFRHELTGRIIVGSTGTRAYAIKPAEAEYVAVPADDGRAATPARLPAFVSQHLRTQNPMLLLALLADPASELVAKGTRVSRADDTRIDTLVCPTLRLDHADGTVVLLALDPATSLPRRVTFELDEVLRRRGVPRVVKARLISDYTQVAPAVADVPASDFAWTPPDNATDVTPATLAPARPAPGATPRFSHEPGPTPRSPVGTPAATPATAPASVAVTDVPAETVDAVAFETLDGRTVRLADLRGSVVVLEFWATWCVPCESSLARLDVEARRWADRGVRTFAVNLREGRDAVAGHVARTRLTLPVLLDPEGRLAREFSVGALPVVVVIGKDGRPAGTYVGGADGVFARLQRDVEALSSDR